MVNLQYCTVLHSRIVLHDQVQSSTNALYELTNPGIISSYDFLSWIMLFMLHNSMVQESSNILAVCL